MTVPGDTRPEGAGQHCAGCGRSVDSLPLLKSQNLTTFVIDDLFCLAIKGTKYLKPSFYLRIFSKVSNFRSIIIIFTMMFPSNGNDALVIDGNAYTL